MLLGSAGGDRTAAAYQLQAELDFHVNPLLGRAYLVKTGGWTSEQTATMDNDTVSATILWLVSCDFREFVASNGRRNSNFFHLTMN